jgi:uncharacterized glyoxalase superfamily protein PhnB
MSDYQPAGMHTVTPRIITADVAGVVAFMKSVLGATSEVHANRPAEVHIGDSMVMVSDGGGAREAVPAFLYVYVPDTDAAYQRALKAGAKIVEAPLDMPYGDRRATVRDPWGNMWQMATRIAV